jgi:cell division protein FtsL
MMKLWASHISLTKTRKQSACFSVQLQKFYEVNFLQVIILETTINFSFQHEEDTLTNEEDTLINEEDTLTNEEDALTNEEDTLTNEEDTLTNE